MKRLVCKKIASIKRISANSLVLSAMLFFMPGHIWGQALIPGTNSSEDNVLSTDVPTPTVASLGKYGDIPVSYYTGSPNISVPLYEIKSRDISMPITLDYDASGIMVNNLPGWAGQNWTLNIGGVITRAKRGEIDEKELSDYQVRNEPVAFENYFKSHGKILEVVSDASDNYKKLRETLKCTENKHWDMSPDIFTFHFLGKSGKFYLGNDGEWKVISNDNLDIVFDYNDESNYSLPLFERVPSLSMQERQKKTISGFVIRDEEGNTYCFGYDKDATEYTTDIWHMSKEEHDESWYANSWYLTSIKDRYGNTIFKFTYERGAYIIQMFNYFCYGKLKSNYGEYMTTSSSFPYTLSISSPVYLKKVEEGVNDIYGTIIELHSSYVPDEMATEKLYDSFYGYYENKGIPTRKGDGYLYYFYNSFLRNRIANYTDNLIGNFFYIQGYGGTPIYSANRDEYENMLKTIEMCRYDRDYADDKTKMDILRYSRIKKLDSLTVTCYKNSFGFVFQHGYHNRRLCLESLVQTGKNHNVQGRYNFIYNKFDQLPSDYLTTAVDYWGHYNGRGYKISDIFSAYTYSCGSFLNYSTITTTYINPDAIGGSPDPEYAKIGTLSEIQYPTGGTTCFEYEANDYVNYMSRDRQTLVNVYSNSVGGGLRIKSIKDYDGPSHKTLLRERYYDYNIPDTKKSSGILFANPVNAWAFNLKCENQNVLWHKVLFQTSSVVRLANMSGVPLGYSYVTETEHDFMNDKRQKTVYHYSSLLDKNARDKKAVVCFTDSCNPFDNFTEMDFMRGKLLDKKMYDEEGRIIYSTEYEYRNDNFLGDNFSYTSNMAVDEIVDDNVAVFKGGIAKIYHTKYDVAKETEKTYIYNAGSTPVEISTVTQYDKQDVSYISDYPYTHEINARLLLSEDVTSGTQNEKKVYDYRHFPGGKTLATTSDAYNDTYFVDNWNSSDKNFEWYMYSKMFFMKPSITSYYKNGNLLHKIRNRYTKVSGNVLATSRTVTEYPTGDTAVVAEYMRYDGTGRPQAYKILGQPKKFLMWGGTNNKCLLVESDYPLTRLSYGLFPLLNEGVCENTIKNYMDHIGFGRNATGYVYGPFFKISRIITSNRNVTTYKYDDLYRLCGIYDNDGNLIESYEYNYRKQ